MFVTQSMIIRIAVLALAIGFVLGLWAGNYICATGGWVGGF